MLTCHSHQVYLPLELINLLLLQVLFLLLEQLMIAQVFEQLQILLAQSLLLLTIDCAAARHTIIHVRVHIVSI